MPASTGAETDAIRLTSTVTCPACGAQATETMPEDACIWFRECPSCGDLHRPKPGDCCVYCSYGDVACPPIQRGDGCCASSTLS